MDSLIAKSTKVVLLMALKRKTFSSAESCTAGLIAASIGAIPGASSVLKCSIISYSIESKLRLLKVDSDTVKTFTTASFNVANEMVYGIQAVSGSDIAISTTGELGPIPITNTMIGTVYCSLLVDQRLFQRKIICKENERRKMQVEASLLALTFIEEMLSLV